MERNWKCPLNFPTLNAGSLTVGASTVTINKGVNDFISPSRPFAGAATFTNDTPFAYPDTSGLGTAYAVAALRPADNLIGNAVYTASSVTPTIRQNNGNDGSLEFAAFGLRSRDGNGLTKMQEVGTSRPGAVMLFGQFSSTGTVDIGGGDFSVSKTATGTYTVTFRRTFSATPTVIPCGIGLTARAGVVSKTASQCVIKTTNVTYTATDLPFGLVVIGQKNSTLNDGGRMNLPIGSTQRRPVVIPFTINLSASILLGNPCLTWGTGGTGINVLTYTQPFFRRAPIVVVSPIGTASNDVASCVTATTSSVIVATSDSAGTQQNRSCSGFIVGSGDPSEY